MPRDMPARASSPAPPWLDPALLRALAENVAAGRARGGSEAALERECREQARAYRPSWPATWIEEAAAIALWLGGEDRGA